jgi:putative transposase
VPDPPNHPDDANPSRRPRKRMRRREALGSYRYLTFSCYRRLQLFKNQRIRDAFADALAVAREMHRFRLLAWVIMPEHVHLIIVPRPILAIRAGRVLVASRSTVSTIASDLKGPFAEDVIARWRTLRAKALEKIRTPGGRYRFWQYGGGFDRNIRTEEELWRETCYVNDNPVRRGLVGRAEEWAWSSARWYDRRLSGERVVGGEIPIDADYMRKWEPPAHWMRQAVEIDPRGKGA